MPRENCPVCDTTGAERFLFRQGVPVHQNMLFPTAAAARAINRGTLDMRACLGCGFVYNAAFDSALVDYGPAYENSQDCSPAFNAYLDGLVEYLVTARNVNGGRVVEVGCGKGVFLSKLLAHPNNRSEGVGFDPSYLGPEVSGRMRVVKEFYGPSTAVPADVVICRHVIEHIPEPLELLRTVRVGVGESGETRVFFETPCVEWILRNRVPWDFFYEHCSLFTASSLALALERAGFVVTSVRHVFGWQYLWAEAETRRTGNVTPPSCGPQSRGSLPPITELVRSFESTENAHLTRWHTLLARLTRGPVFAWGAGAKGVTFCNLVDPDRTWLAGVVDVNPAKQGKFLPGSGHAIVSPPAAVKAGAAAVLVLNPNYVAEVRATLHRLSSSATVIDLMQTEELRCAS